MSLLNRPSAGHYSALIVLHRCVRERGPMPRDRLLKLCCPPPIENDLAVKTLNTWEKLGLFVVAEAVRLADDLSANETLPHAARRLAFRPNNNANFWEAEEAGSADFSRALAWALAVDPLDLQRRNWKAVDERQQETLSDGTIVFQNDTRWAGFRAWASYLGFGGEAAHATGFVIDPAPAIADVLPEVFESSRTLAIGDFLARLAQTLPVLDGGEYRREVEGRLRDRPTLASDELSASLSVALERLRIEGRLQLEERSDADTRRLVLGGKVRPVSVVTRVEVVA